MHFLYPHGPTAPPNRFWAFVSTRQSTRKNSTFYCGSALLKALLCALRGKTFYDNKNTYFLNEKESFEKHENQDLPGVQISSSGINIEENLKVAN